MIISCVRGWFSLESLSGALIQPVVSASSWSRESARTLQLRLSRDGVTVDLVSAADHAVERLLVVLKQEVLPDRVVSREVLSLEVVRVHAGAETWG